MEEEQSGSRERSLVTVSYLIQNLIQQALQLRSVVVQAWSFLPLGRLRQERGYHVS